MLCFTACQLFNGSCGKQSVYVNWTEVAAANFWNFVHVCACSCITFPSCLQLIFLMQKIEAEYLLGNNVFTFVGLICCFLSVCLSVSLSLSQVVGKRQRKNFYCTRNRPLSPFVSSSSRITTSKYLKFGEYNFLSYIYTAALSSLI